MPSDHRPGTRQPGGSAQPTLRLVAFNLVNSPNLGDGVLALCLEEALRARYPDIAVVTLDLAGRTSRSVPLDHRGRVVALAILRWLPRCIADPLVEILLGLKLRRTALATWRFHLDRADAVVVGGGQLVQDSDLNFPVKFALLAGECARRHIPIAVCAVGAASARSSRGRTLIGRLLRSRWLCFVSTRDSDSLEVLQQDHGLNGNVIPDPAVTAARLWPPKQRKRRARPVVGLGVAHPMLLRHHGGQENRAEAEKLYCAAITRLQAAGFDVVCFSNGAAEDEAFLARLLRTVEPHDCSPLRLQPRSRSPKDLAAFVADCDAIVAHRLHACILAFAYGIPHAGFCWDSKVLAFFRQRGREELALPFTIAGIDQLANTLAIAPTNDSSCVELAHACRQFDDGLDRMVSALRTSASEDAALLAARELPIPSGRMAWS